MPYFHGIWRGNVGLDGGSSLFTVMEDPPYFHLDFMVDPPYFNGTRRGIWDSDLWSYFFSPERLLGGLEASHSARASPTSTCFHSGHLPIFMNEISRMMMVISLSLDHDPAGGKWTESTKNVSHMSQSMSFWLNLLLELAKCDMSSQKLPYLD